MKKIYLDGCVAVDRQEMKGHDVFYMVGLFTNEVNRLKTIYNNVNILSMQYKIDHNSTHRIFYHLEVENNEWRN